MVPVAVEVEVKVQIPLLLRQGRRTWRRAGEARPRPLGRYATSDEPCPDREGSMRRIAGEPWSAGPGGEEAMVVVVEVVVDIAG